MGYNRIHLDIRHSRTSVNYGCGVGSEKYIIGSERFVLSYRLTCVGLSIPSNVARNVFPAFTA